MVADHSELPRVVITGVGLTAPNGNNLASFRESLLAGRSGVQPYEIRYVGNTVAGICDFDELRYQRRKELRRGTRAGSVGIYCAREAVADAGLDWDNADKSQIGVYVGVTEHGNVETEHELHQFGEAGHDMQLWSHHHNPRTVANNPAGEISLSLGITGPHYTLGAACAAGNVGLIQGVQMLRLGECGVALCGGVSESIRSFGVFASFRSQGALARHDDPTRASRPFDADRTGLVVAEGGCLFVLERLDDARRRGAKIYGEVVGYAINSDAVDAVLPHWQRQAECIELALRRARLNPDQIDIVSTHATGTAGGDVQECLALRKALGHGEGVHFNNTKSFIGHAMGAAGALELAGNLPSFSDHQCHPTINLDRPDPECTLPGLVANEPREMKRVRTILNNSFGMLGINSVVIVQGSNGSA
jgi:3-oxoacyl-[acyl-carrier-protein] synthase II